MTATKNQNELDKNLDKYTVIVRIGRKAEKIQTRCTNQETAHRFARELARNSETARKIELLDPNGVTVERYIVDDEGYELEVLNGTSVQAVRRAQREAEAKKAGKKGRKSAHAA